jgi:hypothetical protein
MLSHLQPHCVQRAALDQLGYLLHFAVNAYYDSSSVAPSIRARIVY